MRKYFEKHPEYSYDLSTGEIFGKNGRALRPELSYNGYLRVEFFENGKRKLYSVHRLICEAEHENPNNLDTVDHIDGNKLNNSAENLRWLSSFDNNSLGHLGKRHTDESKKKMSDAHKGNKNMLGKHHSEETKRKIGEASKKYWATKKSEKGVM